MDEFIQPLDKIEIGKKKEKKRIAYVFLLSAIFDTSGLYSSYSMIYCMRIWSS